jgi:hypothetical protein
MVAASVRQGRARMRRMTEWNCSIISGTFSGVWSLMSTPAEKAFSPVAPRIITTTPASFSNRATASPNSTIMGMLST